MDLQATLHKYWGFRTFRPLQEEIIRSVMKGDDTLALLPTGGGKSLCYQLPALLQPGICVVVTPLIALMKDQVQALNEKGLKAVGIHHALSRMEMDVAVDNCVYGDVKFLYLSPERLQTELLRARLPRMKVNLLAVDEAHCISQWGHDFRPAYLRIAEIRKLIPSAPLLALTATATSRVVEDIGKNLEFQNGKLYQKSFERKNMAYLVFQEEDKLGRLLKICRNVKGTGIVYVRSRGKAREISEFLLRHSVAAGFYHAGLPAAEREARQNNWMKEKIRVIVATNAFGMGIDKANVRFVVHMDLPDCPEAYFQEAGRAGRDGQKSFAVILYNHADILDLQRFHQLSFPGLKLIKQVYNCLGNYYQLATGSGKDRSYPFDLHGFSSAYSMDPIMVFNALKFLEKEGYLAYSDALTNPSRLMMLLEKEELYRFQVAHPSFDAFIRVVLRSYSGLFTEFRKIQEKEIARRAALTPKQTEEMLMKLHKLNVLHYEKQNIEPFITYLEQRLVPEDLRISPENYQERKQFAYSRLQTMIRYVESTNRCRSMMLLEYFGDKNPARCGHCDVCLESNKTNVSPAEFQQISNQLKQALDHQHLSLEHLMQLMGSAYSENQIIKVIRWFRDNNSIQEDPQGNLFWNKKVR